MKRRTFFAFLAAAPFAAVVLPAPRRPILTINRMRAFIRHAKDQQRLYSHWRSAAIEKITLAPKAPFLVTPNQLRSS